MLGVTFFFKKKKEFIWSGEGGQMDGVRCGGGGGWCCADDMAVLVICCRADDILLC